MTMPPYEPPPSGHAPTQGFSVPSPYVVMPRIPEDQPYVVRPTVQRALILFGAVWGLLVLSSVCGLLARRGVDASLLALQVTLIVTYAVAAAVTVYRIGSGGPLLAVGPYGVWIRTRPRRGQAVWLPWPTIAQIRARRWGFSKAVVIQPIDPALTGTKLGVRTTLARRYQEIFFGRGFNVHILFADRPEPEILGALHHYSGGRVPFA